MRYCVAGLAAVLVCVIGGPRVQAAVVEYQVRINGSADAAVVEVGETFSVELWARVTENSVGDFDFGLAGYRLDVLADGDIVAPVELFVNTPAGPKSDGWDAAFDFPLAFANNGAGQIDAAVNPGDVIDHFAAINPAQFGTYDDIAALDWTRISSGQYVAVGEGVSSIEFSGVTANVIDFDVNHMPSGYHADLIDPSEIQVTHNSVTVIPEPTALTLIGLGGAAALLRRRRGQRGDSD